MDRPFTRRLRLTSLRGFRPALAPLTGRDVATMWKRRFQEGPEGHPFWLYVHIPFCPQICSFCQCKTGRLFAAAQLDEYLDWLEAEVGLLLPDALRGRVRFSYIGGGTPNIFDDAQLERLLTLLGRSFRYEDEARRCFEFLPSALRPGTLAQVRRHGFNRLSCGVQSQNEDVLVRIQRSSGNLDRMASIVAEAFALGFDELNLDLVWGLDDEASGAFVDSLTRTLALGATTVTVHKLIPTHSNPFLRTEEDEIAHDNRFRALRARVGDAVERVAPGYVWVLRPNSWVLAKREFVASPRFSLWYYSDNERIHLDMLGLGRHASSRLMGQCVYDNVSRSTRYDPDEPSYATFQADPSSDAALDLVTDLIADGASELDALDARYGAPWVAALDEPLRRLQADGVVRVDGRVVRYLLGEQVFVDQFQPLLDVARGPAVGEPAGEEGGVLVRRGADSLRVVVERSKRTRRYYATVGPMGVFYQPAPGRPDPPQYVVEAIMASVVGELERALAARPGDDAAAVMRRLRDALGS